MVNATEEFFPEINLLNGQGVEPLPSTSSDSERNYPLRRVETGLSDVVGANNGDRPGGFVLVIDGAALEHVSFLFILNLSIIPNGCFPYRHCLMRRIELYYFD